MFDQAAELRHRMHALAERSSTPASAPRLVIIAGAMRDVGASTMAANLAVELSRQGRRTVLVDVGPDGSAARLCRLQEPNAARSGEFTGASLSDVYRGRRPLAASLASGSHGLKVAGDFSNINRVAHPTDDEIETLRAEISKLGQEADLVLVDADPGDSPVARRLAAHADVVLLVTTTVDASIMETYAAIKRQTVAGDSAKIAVAVSRTSNFADAESAAARLRHGCQRFLGRSIDWAGCVAEDSTVAEAAWCAAPFVVLSPRCEAARGIQQAAEYLQRALSSTKRAYVPHTEPPAEQRDVERHLANVSEAA